MAVVEVALQEIRSNEAWDLWVVRLIIGPSTKTLAFRTISMRDALHLMDRATDREIRAAQRWP